MALNAKANPNYVPKRNSAMDKDTTKATVGSGAERMRRHRHLRKVGVRFIPFHLYEDEISALVACGLLDASERQNPTAVAVALGQYLDRNPIQAM